MIDYYEFLQISPNADSETIHRVFRYLAARFHPDNAKTGDAKKFEMVKDAYDVLSNPTRRSDYDATRKRMQTQPLSSSIDFMDQLEGELNRRMAVLAVLYYRRRTSPTFPDLPLAEIEERMGFPRDYLDFTLWYLLKKRYVDKADNATYSLTAEGVDFVEKERVVLPILNGLLTGNSESTLQEDPGRLEDAAFRALEEHATHVPPPPGSGPIILPVAAKASAERRTGRPDRRVGAPDLRENKVERRRNVQDRRATKVERRAAR